MAESSMSDFDLVPEVSSPGDVYPETVRQSQTQRWEHLLAKFKEAYGYPAEFIFRSPGRVNIIGEHVDYSLYEVLPMAITADVLLAVNVTRARMSTIRIANVDNGKFPQREFKIPENQKIEIDSGKHEWSNYFKSGLKGAIELLQKKELLRKKPPVGMDIFVDGNVPPGGGLSSSAAFVCASALATLVGNGVEKVDKKQLVNLAIVSERNVGVNSGGMDQTASIFGKKGSLLHIGFTPLNASSLSFPKFDAESIFVIANTLVAADKYTTGPVNYNLRVVETTLAAQVLAKLHKVDLPSDSSPLGFSLRGFQEAWLKDGTLSYENKLRECMELVKRSLLKEDGYNREDISEILEITVDDLNKRYMSTFPVRAELFQLRKRALHVYSEALRVDLAVSLLRKGASVNSRDFYTSFGILMNESQASCRDLYNCSCPELDQLCELARNAGSYGSRLTGAGWGGCSVHLVPQNKVEDIKRLWLQEYYNKKFPQLTQEQLEEAIVASKPGNGAVVFKVKPQLEEKGLCTMYLSAS